VAPCSRPGAWPPRTRSCPPGHRATRADTAQLGRMPAQWPFLRCGVVSAALGSAAIGLPGRCRCYYLSEVMLCPKSLEHLDADSFQLSDGRPGVVEPVAAAAWNGWWPCAGAVDLWNRHGCAGQLLVPLDATAHRWLWWHSSRFALLLLVVLLLGLGAATAYLLPWSLLPMRSMADPERPAGLFTAWMVMTQKLGSALAVVSARPPA